MDPEMDPGDEEDPPLHRRSGKLLDCAHLIIESIIRYTEDPNEAFSAALLQWKLGADSGKLIQNPAGIVRCPGSIMSIFLLRGIELCDPPDSDFHFLRFGENSEYSEKLRIHAEASLGLCAAEQSPNAVTFYHIDNLKHENVSGETDPRNNLLNRGPNGQTSVTLRIPLQVYLSLSFAIQSSSALDHWLSFCTMFLNRLLQSYVRSL